MRNVFNRPRILVACLMGVSLVSMAILFSPENIVSDLPDHRLEAVVGDAPERNFIKVTDENNDGIPDWKETLVKAEELPTLSKTQNTDVADKESETLTGKFALDFTEDVMLSNIYGTLDKNKPLLIENASQQLAAEITPELYTYTDLTVTSNDSLEALKTYGNRIASISFEHSVPEGTRDALEIIEEVGLTNNREMLGELKPIISAYSGLMESTLKTAVPKTVLDEHLALVNAYLFMYEDVEAMNYFFADPLKSLMHLYRYPDDSSAVGAAIINLYLKLDELGVRFDQNDTTSRLLIIDEKI